MCLLSLVGLGESDKVLEPSSTLPLRVMRRRELSRQKEPKGVFTQWCERSVEAGSVYYIPRALDIVMKRHYFIKL